MSKQLTRRDFLKGTAAGAMASPPSALQAFPPPRQREPTRPAPIRPPLTAT